MERYPKTTAFIGASLALTAYGMSRDHGHGPIQHDVATPSVTCDGGACR